MTGSDLLPLLGIIEVLPPGAEPEERTRLARSTVHADGRSEFWQVTFDGYVYTAHLFLQASPTTPWVMSERTAEVQSVLEAFEGFPEMRELRSNSVIRFYLTTKWGVTKKDLVQLLNVAGEPVPSDESLGSFAAPSLELPAGVEGDFGWWPLAVLINGEPVLGIRADAATPRRAYPVLVDDEIGLLPVATVAVAEWSNDVLGSDFVVRFLIERLNGELCLERSLGGQGDKSTLCVMPDSDADSGRLLAEWVTKNQLEIAVALDVEPFDPLRSASDNVRNEWIALIREDGVRVAFDVSDGALAFMRSELLRVQRYRRCAAAMSHPESSDGRQLHDALAQVADTGDGGLPFSLTWNGPELSPDPATSSAMPVLPRTEASLRGMKVVDLRRILIDELKADPVGKTAAALRKQIFEEQETLSERRMLRWINHGDGYVFYDPEVAGFWRDFLEKLESLSTWGELVKLVASEKKYAEIVREVAWDTWQQSDDSFGVDHDAEEFAGIMDFEDLRGAIPPDAPVGFSNESGDGDFAIIDPFSPSLMGVPWQIVQHYYDETSNRVSSWEYVPADDFSNVIAAATALGWMVAEGSWGDLGI